MHALMIELQPNCVCWIGLNQVQVDKRDCHCIERGECTQLRRTQHMFQMAGNMISDGFRRICCRWFTKEVSLSGTNNSWLVSSCLVEVSDKFSRNSDAHRCVWPKQGKKHSGRSGMHKHLPRRLRKTGNIDRILRPWWQTKWYKTVPMVRGKNLWRRKTTFVRRWLLGTALYHYDRDGAGGVAGYSLLEGSTASSYKLSHTGLAMSMF